MPAAVHKKRVLLALCIAAGIAMLGEIMFARDAATGASVAIWQLELLLLPWVLFVGCYLSLVFTSWFEEDNARLMRRAVSTVGAAGILGLVTMIYFAAMFR